MPRTLLVAPTGHGVGLTTICLGLLRAAERQGFNPGFCKPIAQPSAASSPDGEHTTALVRATTPLDPPEPISGEEAEHYLSNNDIDSLMERVIACFEAATEGADLTVVEGLWAAEQIFYATQVNQALARTLDADVVLVTAPRGRSVDEVVEEVEIASRSLPEGSITGVVLNLVEPVAARPRAHNRGPAVLAGADPVIAEEELAPYREGLAAAGMRLVGAIPKRADLQSPRVSDLADALEAEVLFPGEHRHRRVHRIAVCARGVPGVLDAYKPGTLLIAPSDRPDIMMSASLAALAGTRLSGLLLTHGDPPDARVIELCRRAFDQGLPLLRVPGNSFDTTSAIRALDLKVPTDDRERAEAAMNHVAGHLEYDWLRELVGTPRERRLSPAAFRHQLIHRAREADARIVLPEGEEPRTIAAAALCQARGIARCVLLGRPDRIKSVAADQGVRLPEGIEIIDPTSLIEQYVEPMMALRKHKGLSRSAALDQLQDTVVLGTMMLQMDDVDGLVSGAVHTTAHTIRPALQLVRTKPGCSLVSSLFFMCLPEQVLVFADCAVNPDPSAEQLADIATTTADTAAAFGIEPRVAMISYATGTSAEGAEVEKVAQATALARQHRPELEIDGPMQYDAAIVPSVGAKKAPGSKVAGRARIFIFPDLNTGNTTYKAVQRSAGVVSIGPVLQGLAKPVNDLSRGALVEDIVFTIAITGIQAASLP